MRGYTLVELLIVLLVAVAVCAMSIPVVGYAIEEGRLRGAAFYLSSRLALLRMQAVRRFANVALRFKYDGVKYRYQTFGDGDGDGVKSADITSGRDVPLDLPEAISDKFPGVAFGFIAGCPLVDGSLPDGNPIRIGSSGLLSISPAGTATSGTLYLRGRTDQAYAVVILGVTGRTRLLHCEAGTGIWSVDAR
jgi:prepilin-type N-terminal cleavage/methylation domain-containing protein